MSIMKQDFDSEQFEHRLENLKDTQDGIQQMSSWCLQHRSNHKKIVASWLNVFKKVRVEHRLVLFYLANDVIQYSKRKRYEFVESWATALQRATTMVRDDKVRHKIFRIFKIWEQRAIYSEEYLSDLSGLLSMNPSKKSQANTNVESSTDEFQCTTLVSNIRDCVKLSLTTDKSFNNLPKAPSCDIENIKAQLKDKSHSDDVEKELERYVGNIENHKKHLAAEIKSRKAVLDNLEAAITFYGSQRGEVKVVVSAYKNFGSRIKLVKKKLDEVTPNLPSPLPSPDINAPSPEPDTDINLPEEQNSNSSMNIFKRAFNGYTSYLDGKLPFDINDFKRGESPNKGSTQTASQPIEVIASRSDSDSLNDSFNGPDFYKPEPLNPMGSINPYSASSITLPVPTGQSEYSSLARPTSSNYAPTSLTYGGHNSNRYNPMVPNYSSDSSYISSTSNNSYDASMPLMPPPMPPTLGIGGGSQSDDFNSTWDLDMSWTPLDTSNPFNHCIDTPISPAHFDRESILDDSVDYDDQVSDILPVQDVDHRQLHLPLPLPVMPPIMSILGPNKPRQLDIDHRNLISLTGSPTMRDNEDKYKRTNKTWIAPKDKDFRAPTPVKPPEIKESQVQPATGDIDYRTLSTPLIEKPSSVQPVPHPPLKPPPLLLTGLLSFPEATGSEKGSEESPPEVKTSESKSDDQGYDPSDMVESIDMDMSDDDLEDILREVASEDSLQQDHTEDELEHKHELAQAPAPENEHEQNSQQEEQFTEEQYTEEYDDQEQLDESVQQNAEEHVQTLNSPAQQLVSYRDNLIPVANNRPPLLNTPPNSNISIWETQQQVTHFQPNFEEHPGREQTDNGIHNTNMRPPVNPWKQPRMPFRMPGPTENHQHHQPVPGGYHQPGEFPHHQQFPRFPRNPFQQPVRNFGPHPSQNHFRGSPRHPRGNPFFKNRGRGGFPGGGPGGRSMFRGKFRGNPWL